MATSVRGDLGSALASRLFPEESAAVLDPVAWIEGELGDRLWSSQREIAESVRDERYTAVQAAHGVGKSHLAARIMAWHCSVHPPGEAFALSSAPSGQQIDAVVWRELDQAHGRGRLRGEITGRAGTRQWRIGGRLVALGRKSADFIDADRASASFQGLHAPHMLVVLDEAVGIQPWLFDAVDSLLTNENARVLALGNPTDPTSRFADICAPGSGWNVIKVSAFDTPAFTGEKVPPQLLDQLVSERWVDERRERWGEESPAFIARVLGEFPEESEDGLISPGWIRAAQDRDLSGQAITEAGVLGVDVGRTGDETVIYRNRGGMVRLEHQARGQDLMRTTGAVAAALSNGGCAVVDATGLGFGVCDRLREQSFDVIAFQGAERARRPKRFTNRRAEVYWALREAFRAGEVDLDPADDELAAQLGAIRWFTNSRGLVQIESKDDMRKRGVASPDRADALALAFSRPGSQAPAAVVVGASIVPSWEELARDDGVPSWAEMEQGRQEWERRFPL